MSKIRWWESARNLGFNGTIAAGLVVAALVGILAFLPFGRVAVAIWYGLVYRVPVPAVILVAMLVLLMMADLEALPGVGAATAKLIVEHREKNGGFKKVEEKLDILGIRSTSERC